MRLSITTWAGWPVETALDAMLLSSVTPKAPDHLGARATGRHGSSASAWPAARRHPARPSGSPASGIARTPLRHVRAQLVSARPETPAARLVSRQWRTMKSQRPVRGLRDPVRRRGLHWHAVGADTARISTPNSMLPHCCAMACMGVDRQAADATAALGVFVVRDLGQRGAAEGADDGVHCPALSRGNYLRHVELRSASRPARATALAGAAAGR